ncbi:ephrin-A3b isoform X2 [Pungitius pungitius]|uniref:ephrin-A3b isoform X2 n=1 Tax=Pungitius pungitius TaxID=134920 RepID=UPI002E13AD06
MALVALSLWVLTSLTWADVVQVTANRHSVYWNSSNIHLRREGYTMQVNVNDYLDIYCPHYNDSQRGAGSGEQYVLYMVSYRGYRNCDPQLGFKRWECNRPHAPHAPIKFSEKFQRYSAFSLGYEFHVGQEYYYISTPTHHHGRSCLRLRVYVCCSTGLPVMLWLVSLSRGIFLTHCTLSMPPPSHVSLKLNLMAHFRCTVCRRSARLNSKWWKGPAQHTIILKLDICKYPSYRECYSPSTWI